MPLCVHIPHWIAVDMTNKLRGLCWVWGRIRSKFGYDEVKARVFQKGIVELEYRVRKEQREIFLMIGEEESIWKALKPEVGRDHEA